MRFVLRLAGSGAFLCVAYSSGVLFAQSHMLATNDPIRAQLLTKGKPGLAAAQAHSNVIEILQSKNSCSAWFQRVDPNAASTFASLNFFIETNGPREVLGLRSGPREMRLKHPYAAKALENRSFVVLNANGAFFVRAAPVFQQDNQGGFYRLSGSHELLVGSYSGNTRAAQMAILLHELRWPSTTGRANANASGQSRTLIEGVYPILRSTQYTTLQRWRFYKAIGHSYTRNSMLSGFRRLPRSWTLPLLST